MQAYSSFPKILVVKYVLKFKVIGFLTGDNSLTTPLVKAGMVQRSLGQHTTNQLFAIPAAKPTNT